MKAMVYYGEHDIRFEERQKPQLLNSGDVIIRMVKTTICGTDLGILKGKNPEIQEIALTSSARLMVEFWGMRVWVL
ncbi:hypothetical protein J4S50_004445 [Salmonella enterica]|nr:hypothetical protein [Salmonella enterica]